MEFILPQCAAYEYGEDESDVLVPPSSCSSPSDSEDFSSSLEPTDGYYILDDDVGKRLNQMTPIPVSLPYKIVIVYYLSFSCPFT